MTNEPTGWQPGVDYASQTHIGMRRTNNQDALVVMVAPTEQQWITRGHLFMVADGMGAHAAGELASKLAVDTIPLVYNKLRELAPPDALQKAIEDANEKIHTRGEAHAEFKGMGTTASILLLLPQGAVVGHVGDSRVYRLRGNRLEQLSFDHSLVWELRASQQQGHPEIQHQVPKNIITRSLGPNPQVNVDVEGPFPLVVGEVFLVCSDGLSGQVDNTEIGVILGCLPADEAARVLVDLANLRGGPDNITLCVVRVTGTQITPTASAASPTNHSASKSSDEPFAGWFLWGTVGVFVIAAIALGVTGHYLGACVALLAAFVAAILVIWQQKSESYDSAFTGPAYGSGPHSTQVCVADPAFVRRLEATVNQLKDAAVDQDWSVDWHRFNQLCQAAADALKRDDRRTTVQNYYRAIAHMMGELRGQSQGERPESTADVDPPRSP